MEYVSSDPVEAPLVLFDTRKGSGLKARETDAGVAIGDGFRRMLWLAQGIEVPAVPSGETAGTLAEAFRKERERFARMHAAPLSHDFALQRLNAPAAPLVWVEMEGGKEDLVYELDRVDHPSEALMLLHASESRDPELRKFLWPVALSHQPVDRDARDPAPPRFLLTSVDVDLAATAGNDAKMTAAETFVPVSAPIAALRLDLVGTWYASSGSNLATRAEKVQRGDRRSRPRSRVRPPRRRDRRTPGGAGATRPSPHAALRDRRRFPDPARRRQLLGARHLVLVSAAVPGRAGLHVPRGREGAGAVRAVRVGIDAAPRAGRRVQRRRDAGGPPDPVRGRPRGEVRDARRGPRRRHDPRRDLRTRERAFDEGVDRSCGRGHRVLPDLPRSLPVRPVRHHRDQRLRIRAGAARNPVHHPGGLRPPDRRHDAPFGPLDRAHVRPRDRAPVLGHRGAHPRLLRAVVRASRLPNTARRSS